MTWSDSPDEADLTIDEVVPRALGLWGRLGHSARGDQFHPPDPPIGADRLAAAQRLHEALAAAHARRPLDLAAPRPTLTNAAQQVAEYDTEDPDRFNTQMALVEVIGAHMGMAILDATEREREERARIAAEAIRSKFLHPRAKADLPRRWRATPDHPDAWRRR